MVQLFSGEMGGLLPLLGAISYADHLKASTYGLVRPAALESPDGLELDRSMSAHWFRIGLLRGVTVLKHNWIVWGTAVFAFCSLSVQALAVERWESLGKHALGEMYLERPSVSQKGSVVTYWVRRVYATPQESKISQMKFTEQRVFHVLDCNKHTMGMTQMVFYDAKGKPVGAYKDLKKAPQPILPTGFFAKEEKLLCPVSGHAVVLPVKAPAVKPTVEALPKAINKH